MFFNICENAIKYNHKGGEVVFTISKMNDYPIVIVEDTGIGIPKEDLDRIFERFYRVDKSHSNQKKGSGLGLSIVKHGANSIMLRWKLIVSLEKERRSLSYFQNKNLICNDSLEKR